MYQRDLESLITSFLSLFLAVHDSPKRADSLSKQFVYSYLKDQEIWCVKARRLVVYHVIIL